MDELLKFFFYLIIILIWIISALKKRGKWEEKIPEFPQDAPPSPAPNKLEHYEEPQREGLAQEEEKKSLAIEGFKLTYEENLKEKMQRIRPERKKTKLKPTVSETQIVFKEAEQPVKFLTKEEGQKLWSDQLKDGIMWSIIFGPPRSKHKIDLTNLPWQR